VLLKNDANLLPLDKHSIKSVAVIGPDACPAIPVGGGSAGVRPFAAVSFLEGISSELGPSVHTYYRRGIPEFNELAEATTFSTEASGGSPGLVAEYFSNLNLEGDPIIRRNDSHLDFGAGSLPRRSCVIPVDGLLHSIKRCPLRRLRPVHGRSWRQLSRLC